MHRNDFPFLDLLRLHESSINAVSSVRPYLLSISQDWRIRFFFSNLAGR